MHKLIVITSSDLIPNEAEIINALFQSGLQCLHIRKPAFSRIEIISLINNIKPIYRSKLMIHSFYELALEYGLCGIHLTQSFISTTPKENTSDLIKNAHECNMLTSSSTHSLNDIKQLKYPFNYVFLSPIFDSISKQNYISKFSLSDCTIFLQTYHSSCKIVALGGISESNIGSIFQAGFHGTAVLGAIWNNKNKILAFEQIKKQIQFSE